MFILDRLKVWDVDQGAHLFWSDHWMLDMAGLVDVSVAHHQFEKEFMQEYLFTEERPHLAHVHGGWANNSKIPTFPEWRQQYVEIPGYPAGKKQFHIGNYVRRDVFLPKYEDGVAPWPWTDTTGDRRVQFQDGITVEGLYVPSEASQARYMYVEVGVHSRKRRRKENFRMVLFATDGTNTHSWDLAPTYDYIQPAEWREEEMFWGKYALALPKTLPAGEYDLGLVMLSAKGEVLGAGGPPQLPEVEEVDEPEPPNANNGQDEGDVVDLYVAPDAVVGGAAVFAYGEVRFPKALKIVSVDDNRKLAREGRERAIELARDGQCETAEHTWWLARMHRPINDKWLEEFLPRVKPEMARCWVARAAAEPDAAIDHLDKARQWDFREPSYVAAGKAKGDALYQQGLEARAAQDWETAYQRFTDSLRVWRPNAWARRYAEEARDQRLGLSEEKRRQMREEQDRQNIERRLRRERAKAKRKAKAKKK